MVGTATARALGFVSKAALAISSVVIFGAFSGPPGGGSPGGGTGPPLPFAMIQNLDRECVTFKNTVHRLQLQEDGDFATLIEMIDRRPSDCTAKEAAWLGYIRVRALLKTNQNEEALAWSDSLLRYQWMFYNSPLMGSLTTYKGTALFYLDRFAEARAPMESARRHYRKKKNFNPVTMANLDHNLAAVEMVMGDSLSAVCRLAYAETIIRLAGDTRHLRELLEAINLAQARLARFGVVNTDRLCLLGEIRRRPANDDGQHEILLIIFILFVAVVAYVIYWALATVTRRS